MMTVSIRVSSSTLDKIAAAAEEGLGVTMLRRDFAATRKVILDGLQRSVLPTRLSRNKTLNIEAGELREMGIAVPPHIPNYAWVPRSSIRFDIPDGQQNIEQNGVDVVAMFEAPFCATPVSTTERPPPAPPPTIPKTFAKVVEENGIVAACEHEVQRWAQIGKDIRNVFKKAFKGAEERTEEMGRGSNKKKLPKEPKKEPVKVSVQGVGVPELDADEIVAALARAVEKPLMNTADEPHARIIIPGPDTESVYSIFVSAEAYSIHDAMWHVSACIVNKSGGVRAPSDDERKMLVGLCGAVVARVGISEDEAYQTPGGIHYWKPMTPEEWNVIPMFGASDAHHEKLPGDAP